MEEIRIIRNLAMGALIKKYASNGQFFTNTEFEKHKGEILQVGHTLFKLSGLLKDSGKSGETRILNKLDSN